MEQLVNSRTSQVLEVAGLALWQLGEEDQQGFSTLVGKEVQWSNAEPVSVVMDRGWGEKNGKTIGLYKEHGAPNQRFKLQPVASDCEKVDATDFYIENAKTGEVLSLDTNTGVVSLTKKVPDAIYQLWRRSSTCNEPEEYLVNSAGGAVLAADVTNTKEQMEGNAWMYDMDKKTLKSSLGYARAFKKGAHLRMQGSLSFLKGTDTPWKWFQWTLTQV